MILLLREELLLSIDDLTYIAKEYIDPKASRSAIVGEVANALREEVPDQVTSALKKLALRGTMRDIASAIQRDEERSPGVPSFHEVVDIGAAAVGLSWTEALCAITCYLDTASKRLG